MRRSDRYSFRVSPACRSYQWHRSATGNGAAKDGVPYLDVVERLLVVLSDFEQGAVSRSSLDYFVNPATWWLGRGAQRVIFVQQGGPDDVPLDRDAVPDGPIDRPTPARRVRVDDRSEKQPAARLASYLKPATGKFDDGLMRPDTMLREPANGALIVASGSYFQLEWQESPHHWWCRGDWILLPYVHPVEDSTRKRFVKEAKKAIGFRGSDDAKLAKALLDKLRSMEDAKKLVEIYNRHFAGGHNAISMSLYSGPLSRDVNQVSPARPTEGWHSFVEEPSFGRFFWYARGVGWLGTGDAALRQNKWRDPWRSFFEPLDDRIATMTLPHHGSANNFHPEVLAFTRLEFALAATVEARNRVARLREPLGVVEAQGIRTLVVDDQRLSRFTTTCERDMS